MTLLILSKSWNKIYLPQPRKKRKLFSLAIQICYLLPTSDPVDSFKKLELNLSSLAKEEKKVILFGDTNCDIKMKQGVLMDNNAKQL